MAEATLKLDTEERSGVRIIHVAGPLDSMNYDTFKAQMDALIGKQARARIVLDCQNLTYVNSRGLALLMHYQRVSKLDFSFLGIAALRPRILKGMEMLGLGKFVTSFTTVEEALEMATAS
jgi:anti-anti-sigma factor